MNKEERPTLTLNLNQKNAEHKASLLAHFGSEQAFVDWLVKNGAMEPKSSEESVLKVFNGYTFDTDYQLPEGTPKVVQVERYAPGEHGRIKVFINADGSIQEFRVRESAEGFVKDFIEMAKTVGK